MIITYDKNPLHTIVELDDNEKKELWYKIKINELEDRISSTKFYLRNNKYFNIDKARDALDIEYDESDNNQLDEYCNQLLDYYVNQLALSHSGDCTCAPYTCDKCYAESLLGIDTIKGLERHSANKIKKAFDNNRTIDEALEYLSNYDGIPDDLILWEAVGGYKQYVDKWKSEAKSAYDWLLLYKKSYNIN